MKEILNEHINKKIEIDGTAGYLREISDHYLVVDLQDELDGNEFNCIYKKYIPFSSILEIIIEKRAFFFYDDENEEEKVEDDVLIIRLIRDSFKPIKPSSIRSNINELRRRPNIQLPDFLIQNRELVKKAEMKQKKKERN